MEEDKFVLLVFSYILMNIVLFFLYRATKKLKVMHRIISSVDNIIFVLIIGYEFYRANPLLVILVPCLLLVVYPISWGLNKELSGEELASLVSLKSPFPLGKESRRNLKVGFVHFATFPFYYLLDSWSKNVA